MFWQFVRLAVYVGLILALIALSTVSLCLGGLMIGSLLNAYAPSIDFGTAVLIAVVALGFSAVMFVAVLLITPLWWTPDRQEQPESDEDEEEFHGRQAVFEEEFARQLDEDETVLVGRIVESLKRREDSPQPRSLKSKRRRGSQPRRGGK